MNVKEDQKLELLEEGESGWIVTYADLMTLLLVFFILLYSISTLHLERFKRAMSSIQTSLGEVRPPIGLFDLAVGPGVSKKKVVLENLTGLRSRKQEMLNNISKFIDTSDLEENIKVSVYDGKITIRIKGKVLFESGNAELNEEAKPILSEIVRIFSEFPEYKINIKGHTDNIPISTKQFPSNWELSAIRSTTVLKYLIERGIHASRLTATGYGELLPLIPNTSDENRAINRRVEFELEKESDNF